MRMTPDNEEIGAAIIKHVDILAQSVREEPVRILKTLVEGGEAKMTERLDIHLYRCSASTIPSLAPSNLGEKLPLKLAI